MKVTLVSSTLHMEHIVARAANECYTDEGWKFDLEQDHVEKIIRKCVKSGHHSVLEHGVFTFEINGVSRAMTHQLVRHRLASYSQQSQRYVRLDEPSYVTPPFMESDLEVDDVFRKAMENAWASYNRLVELGAKPEDARFVLPNACTTNIVVTMNCRELLHFFSLRTCSMAQWEIRDVAKQMLDTCKAVAPTIFENAGPPCARGPCQEGKRSCGRPWKVGP